MVYLSTLTLLACLGLALADTPWFVSYNHGGGYANASMDVTMLCHAMPDMIGCELQELCVNGDISGHLCDSFQILGTICDLDNMMMMKGCKGYSEYCPDGSSECGGTAGFPKTSDTVSSIVSMCGMMTMSGCDGCSTGSCTRPLERISALCSDMAMDGCSTLTDMCSTVQMNEDNEISFLCGASDAGVATMKMYFHTGIRDYILFKEWLPTSDFEYAMACIATIALGVFTLMLKRLRQTYEVNHMIFSRSSGSPSGSPLILPNEGTQDKLMVESFFPQKHHLAPNTVRAAFSFFIVGCDFLLMLIAMTYNAGIFLCVIGGLSLGVLIFGHEVSLSVLPNPPAAHCCE